MTFNSTLLNPYADQAMATSTYPHCYPLRYDSDPELYYCQDISRIPCQPTVTTRLQDPHIECDKNLGWSIEWAVAFIVDHLDPKNSSDAPRILRNIRFRAAALQRDGLDAEIPYLLFNKLDETLFAGRLKNAVYLSSRKLGPEVSGATHSQGWGLDPKVKRVSIFLNQEVLQNARSPDIVATLIHHMIHAYFLIACGPQVEKEEKYGRLDHGLPFGKIMTTIKNLSEIKSRPLVSLDFGHALGPPRRFMDEYSYQRRKPSHLRRGKEKWYCSHCFSDIDPLSDGEIEQWYGEVCKPLFDLPESLRASTVQIYNECRHSIETIPRGEAPLSTESFEFVFRNQSVLVPAYHVEKFYSIGRTFEKQGSRYLEIHEDVEKGTFERFLELLHTGSYGPDPKHIHALGGEGPPIIKSPAQSEPYLVTDLRVYKMGVLMSFNELRKVAQERMNKHSITYEDPIALLKEIYDGAEPDNDLKAWVRKFLVRAPTPSDGDWMGGSWPTGEPSNLAKLESDLLGYKPRFFNLLQKSSALKYEVSQAKNDLIATGRYTPSSMYGAMDVGLRAPLGAAMGAPLVRGMGMTDVARPSVMELRWTRMPPGPTAAADPYLGIGFGYPPDFDYSLFKNVL